MKELIAKEFMFFFIALIVAVPVGFLFVYLEGLEPLGTELSESEKVLEMEFLIVGAILGFLGVYIVRLTVWAAGKLASKE